MNKVIVLFLFITSAVVLYAEDGTLFYEADAVDYHDDTKEIILRGNCHVKHKEAELKAETIYYDVNNETMLAIGNVELITGSTSLTGRMLDYNLKTKQANIQSARVPVEKGYVTGEQLTADGSDTIFGMNTNFTTCNLSPSHFRIFSKRMKVMKDNKIVASPVVFYVGHVPIFYFPAYLIPIPKGRQSGFLMPSISNNTIDGLTFMSSFFFVIDSYSDITYTAKIMSLRGIEHIGEYRFKTRYGGGTFDGSFLEDKLYSMQRWKFKGSAKQDIKPLGVTVYALSNFYSDISIPSDLGESYDERTANEATSYLTVSKELPSLAAINLLVRQDRRWWTNSYGSFESRSNLLPSLSFNVYNVSPLKNLTLSMSSFMAYNQYVQTFDESEPNYADVQEDLTKNEKYILTTVNTQYRHDFFQVLHTSYTLTNQFDHYDTDNGILERWVPSASAQVYVDVFGYFDMFGIGNNDLVKHKITPLFMFSYRPEVAQDRFINAGRGSYPHQETVSFSLQNSLMTKVGEENKRFTFFTSTHSISYNLLTDERNFSMLTGSYTLTPYLGKTMSDRLQVNHTFDTYERKTTAIQVSDTLTYAWSGKNSFNATASYIKYNNSDEIVSLRARTSYWFTENWRVNHEIVFNVADNKIESQTYELYRNLHCWHMSISWELRETGATEYKFYIQLNAYDDFKWDYKKRFEGQE